MLSFIILQKILTLYQKLFHEMIKDIADIDDVLLNKEIFTEKFKCDLGACKGACCTMESELGAPVEESEIEQIENELDTILEALPKWQAEVVKKYGYWEEKQGQLMIKSINNKECVFAIYDDGIARCAIEKLYFDKKVKFRKPISCFLFPIRISEFGGPVIRYERYDDCIPAMKNGEEENVTVFEFCKDSLIERFGEDWYNKAKKIAGS